MNRFIAAFAVAGLTAMPAFAQCTKDTDCKGDRICSKGMCVEPNAPTPNPAVAPVLTQDQIVTMFENGDADGARDEAERARLNPLVEKLKTFSRLYTVATNLRESGPTDEQISQNEAALAASKAITPRESTYAKNIRKRLSKYWLSRAEAQFAANSIELARASILKSLEYNPANAHASNKLAEINNNSPRAPSSPPLSETPVVRADPQTVSPPDPSFVRARKFRLLDEREKLIAGRPGLGWPIAGLVLGTVGIVGCTLGLAAGGLPALYVTLLVVDVILMVAELILLGVNNRARANIDARVRQIDRQLLSAAAPMLDFPVKQMVVLRF